MRTRPSTLSRTVMMTTSRADDRAGTYAVLPCTFVSATGTGSGIRHRRRRRPVSTF